MHRALEIPEIPPMIVSHFNPDNYELGSEENIDSPTLAALARCRVFHEAAVNQLWKKQETLVNLIRCLPEDISNIKDLEESDLVFHRAPIASDWARADYYTASRRTHGRHMSARSGSHVEQEWWPASDELVSRFDR
ncbi:hypothetical protein R3P38DRAFT_1606670 [Favolaschia claudopus]|uniref:Uncharacterized protein n=1 Tax=Favolaschia claudopus TaxID=2862362 RepID=A0AAW0AJK8_9AGAR